MMLRRSLFSALLCALGFAWGCAEGPRPAPETACDLFADAGCPAEEGCRLVAGGEGRCVPHEATSEDTCVPGSCAVDEACVAVEGLLGCHEICRFDGTVGCDRGLCAYPVDGATDLGVCSRPCVLGDDCGSGGTCGPSGATPHAVCIATGSGQVGQACADARCAAGLGCLSIDGSPRCYRLCTAGSVQECDGEACTGVIVNEGILGYCVPPNVESP